MAPGDQRALAGAVRQQVGIPPAGSLQPSVVGWLPVTAHPCGCMQGTAWPSHGTEAHLRSSSSESISSCPLAPRPERTESSTSAQPLSCATSTAPRVRPEDGRRRSGKT